VRAFGAHLLTSGLSVPRPRRSGAAKNLWRLS
jgi:hypothetical protein